MPYASKINIVHASSKLVDTLHYILKYTNSTSSPSISSFRMMTFYFIKFVEYSPQRNLKQRLTTLYNGVETFVLFIGHARSGHSLIGAILDAHPEIIIPHEWNAIAKWDEYKHTRGGQDNTAKTRLFFDLHSLSRSQAMFGNRAPSGSKGKQYSYHVPGQWQGTYRDKIRVS